LVDLGSLQVTGTIAVGSFPRGVAIFADRNLAVVANGNSNDVSVLDLTRKVERSRIPVGLGPQGVVVNPAAHSAVVTNSGFVRGVFTPGASVSTSASLINLDWDQAELPLAVGVAPFGIDLNGDTTVIANYGSNNVTIIRPFPNPAPHISAMQPKV